jgi:hypothetical protein
MPELITKRSGPVKPRVDGHGYLPAAGFKNGKRLEEMAKVR